MSDRVVRSFHESEGTSEQTSYPCESVLMAHWMSTSCKSETNACGHVSIHYEEAPKRNGGVQKHPLFRGFGEPAAPKRVRTSDGDLALTDRMDRLEGQSFPMFGVPLKTSLAKPNQQASTVHRGILSESRTAQMLGWTTAEAWPLEAIPPFPKRQMRYHDFMEDNSTASDSKISHYRSKGGSSSILSFSRNMEIDPSNSLLAPQLVGNDNIYRSSICEVNSNNKLFSRTPQVSLSRQNDVVLLQRDPLTSGKHVLEVQSNSAIPSQRSSAEVTKLEKAYGGFFPTPSQQSAVRNMETMRICAAVDVEKESYRSHTKFFWTTPFPRKTSVRLSEDHMFGETTASIKLRGKAFSEHLVSPERGFSVQTGFKLLEYRNSTDSEEENKNVKRHADNMDNESSSQTDTMDMGDFQFQDNLLGPASSPTNEHAEVGQQSSQSAFTSAREEGVGRSLFTKLPDMNQELPDLEVFASIANERETSTSRTQSLDVEHLLSHAEQLTNSKSSGSPDGPQGLEPSCRWVARFKLSASHFGSGTKIPKLGEASSHEKVSAFFDKNMRCRVTNSQPAMDIHHGSKQMALDQNPMLLRNGESSSSDSARRSQNITLSHPWIRRWSHKVVAPHGTSEAATVFEPQCSKETLAQYQKKKFPSIAAMALMGKAMNGFNPCEFAKRGSFVVWNTKEF